MYIQKHVHVCIYNIYTCTCIQTHMFVQEIRPCIQDSKIQFNILNDRLFPTLHWLHCI